MLPSEVKDIFIKAEALLSGHFVLSSGQHSEQYLQCALVTQYPAYAQQLAAELADKFKDAEINVVLGPAIGGIVIAQEVGQALARQGKKVRIIFCERVEGKMTLRRGFALKAGEKVLAVEDVITTGGSVKEAIDLAKTYGVDVIGVGTFIDRSATAPDLGAPLQSLLKVEAHTYAPDTCPLCAAGTVAVKPGSRGLK